MREILNLWRDKFSFWQRSPKLTTQQLHFICKQLSFALASGMPLPAALLLVGSEMDSKRCKTFLIQIAQYVQQGQSTAQALKQSTILYSPVLLEFILAGEQNGTMQETMAQAAEYFQQQHKTKQMLFSALFYPAIILLLTLFSFVAMFLFVVPAVIQTYDNFQAELPILTKIMIACGQWIYLFWPILIISFFLCLGFSIVSLQQMLRKEGGRKRIKIILLHIPVAGRLYQQYWFIQIIQGMGLMLSSGMLLVHCLQSVQEIYKRSLFSEELAQLTKQVTAGQSFALGLQSCSFLPQMALRMLTVSEQTSSLSLAMVQLSQYYQQQFQQRLQMLIRLLEPCFIVLLGFAVLLMAGSLFIPMIESYQYLL